MGRVTLDDVIAEGDPLNSSDFLMQMDLPAQIRNIVEEALGILSARSLTNLCQGVNIPTKALSVIPVKLFGHTYKFKGPREDSEPLTMSFVEGALLPIYQTLNAWFEYQSATASGDAGAEHRGTGQRTTTDIFVTPLSVTGDTGGQFVFRNAWLSNFGDHQYSGEGADIVRLNATFEYDYFEFTQADATGKIGRLISQYTNINALSGISAETVGRLNRFF